MYKLNYIYSSFDYGVVFSKLITALVELYNFFRTCVEWYNWAFYLQFNSVFFLKKPVGQWRRYMMLWLSTFFLFWRTLNILTQSKLIPFWVVLLLYWLGHTVVAHNVSSIFEYHEIKHAQWSVLWNRNKLMLSCDFQPAWSRLEQHYFIFVL